MRSWPVQEAKAKFSELVETALAEGPQLVTRRGSEAVVVVPAETWKRLEAGARPTLKALLLAPEARAEDLAAPRRRHKHRPPPDFG
ncbi:MAG: type II toxin-antitoxin system Phd/YefM family antitoxin [Alphaproteobacteria bacterium]|nr:type II toxin-antitoxin system Phd/YefM family antitoxin [Alphaproteobacteria bacterium]